MLDLSQKYSGNYIPDDSLAGIESIFLGTCKKPAVSLPCPCPLTKTLQQTPRIIHQPLMPSPPWHPSQGWYVGGICPPTHSQVEGRQPGRFNRVYILLVIFLLLLGTTI